MNLKENNQFKYKTDLQILNKSADSGKKYQDLDSFSREVWSKNVQMNASMDAFILPSRDEVNRLIHNFHLIFFILIAPSIQKI